MKHHLLFRRPTALLGTESVVTFPWERAVQPGYQVAIYIRRLDAMSNNKTRLTTLWRHRAGHWPR